MRFPEKIYLEPEIEADVWCERSWCEDQIEDDWQEYVRADLVNPNTPAKQADPPDDPWQIPLL